MVRLKREIEGAQRHPGVPVPGYALTRKGSALVLPWLDTWLVQQEPGRVLLAGVPRMALARQLAQLGHWVTVSDLAAGEAVAVQAELTPTEAGRLTLVERDYGEVAFGPSSFDLIVLFDALQRYREPHWLVHKAQRELKVDGRLVIRALVRGNVPDHPKRLPLAQPSPAEAGLSRLMTRAESRLHGPVGRVGLGRLLLGPRAMEALDRGAHLQGARFAQEAADVLADVISLLDVEQLAVGHSRRMQLAEWCWDARALARRVLPIWADRLPALATEADLRLSDSRALGIVARKRLGYRAPTPT